MVNLEVNREVIRQHGQSSGDNTGIMEIPGYIYFTHGVNKKYVFIYYDCYIAFMV